MQRRRSLGILFLTTFGISMTAGLASATAADGPQVTRQPWVRQAARAFRGETPAATVTRRFSLKEPDLAKASASLKPDSIEAAGVAYLGAMQSRGAKPWVSRLVLASAQRSALSAETDVRLYLPKALQRILATYHSRPALEALMDLRMDGAYAYDLYDVRLGALLADPAAWEVSLRSRPEEVP
jgi:hypothetical protein